VPHYRLCVVCEFKCLRSCVHTCVCVYMNMCVCMRGHGRISKKMLYMQTCASASRRCSHRQTNQSYHIHKLNFMNAYHIHELVHVLLHQRRLPRYIYLSIYTYVCACVRVCVCVCVATHARTLCMYVCVSLCIFVRAYTCVFVCLCIFVVCSHTHRHQKYFINHCHTGVAQHGVGVFL